MVRGQSRLSMAALLLLQHATLCGALRLTAVPQRFLSASRECSARRVCPLVLTALAEGESPPATKATVDQVGSVAPVGSIANASATSGNESATEQEGRIRNAVQTAISMQTANAKTSEEVLALTEKNFDALNIVNVVTALHRLAVINKVQRANRDRLLRDPRFEQLVESIVANSKELSPRGAADVLWSFATLQHWPSMLLSPVLTSVAGHLKESAFEAQHLSTMMWALARLECKPVRLLEQIEEQAILLLGEMNAQNCANLAWGFAKLQYQPEQLLPPLTAYLTTSDVLAKAKPVEVADTAFALGMLGKRGAYDELLATLAARASPEGILSKFSSRQLVILIWAFARLGATDGMPAGLMDQWVSTLRAAHETTPLLVRDANNLERSLMALGLDASWIKRSEMLNTWSDLAEGRGQLQKREYTDEELSAAFEAIDTDGSGDIDMSELQTAIRAINPEMDDATVKKMLTFGDEDGDCEVSLDEFKKIMRGGRLEGAKSS